MPARMRRKNSEGQSLFLSYVSLLRFSLTFLSYFFSPDSPPTSGGTLASEGRRG